MRTVFLLFATFVLLSTSLHSQTKGLPFVIAQDKLLHLGAGYVIGASTTAAADAVGSKYAIVWGVAASILASVGKEYYDSKTGGTVELFDAYSGIVGGCMGSVTVSLPIYKRERKKTPILY